MSSAAPSCRSQAARRRQRPPRRRGLQGLPAPVARRRGAALALALAVAQLLLLLQYRGCHLEVLERQLQYRRPSPGSQACQGRHVLQFQRHAVAGAARGQAVQVVVPAARHMGRAGVQG
jgi:hypothetical protein